MTRQVPHDTSIGLQTLIQRTLADIATQDIVGRVALHDHTVWKPDPHEITDRLAWLELPRSMRPDIGPLRAFADEVRAAGFQRVLLMGMGGSSLAPEVYSKVFGTHCDGLPLRICDSTHPDLVRAITALSDPETTLFLVSTKSGGTVETLSLFKHFYNHAEAVLGAGRAGDRFVAITDPDSRLYDLARLHKFRRYFLNNPNIGGRYSALSHFGLVPAALIGIDLQTLLDRARKMADACASPLYTVQDTEVSGATLGARIGTQAREGKDKLTFILSPEIESFGDWLEQLIAESTGKERTGILPVVGEQPVSPADYRSDRQFAYIRLGDDATYESQVASLREAGFPVATCPLGDRYDLGAQIYLWEYATAIAGWVMRIQPFDQPNVEAAKVRAREMVVAYRKQGQLPAETPVCERDGIAVYSTADGPTDSPVSALRALLDNLEERGYVALQAYVPPSPEIDEALVQMRQAIQKYTGNAVSVGYGPRFLHSTGQLHKGDGGGGVFVQLTSDVAEDLPIPDEAGKPVSSISFGTLIQAQAMGDNRALRDAGRHVLRFHLTGDVAAGVAALAASLK